MPAMTEETSFWSSGRRATFSGWWTENAENLRLPKKKRRKHVVSAGVWTHPVAGRLQDGEPVLDSDIRRALAAFRNRFSEMKEV